MKKTVIKFSPTNIDFLYIMQHILFADWIYKKNILSEKGLNTEAIEEYKRMTRHYLDKKLYNFNANILTDNIVREGTADHLEYTIKIYPSYEYKILLPLNKFKQEIIYIDIKTGQKTELDLEYIRFDFDRNIEIKEHEPYKPPPPRPKVKPRQEKKNEPKPQPKQPKSWEKLKPKQRKKPKIWSY